MISWLIRLFIGSPKAKPKVKTKAKAKRKAQYARSPVSIEIPDSMKDDIKDWIKYYKPLVGLGNRDLDVSYWGAVTAYKRGDWLEADGWLGGVANWIGQHDATDRKRKELRMYSYYRRKLARYRVGGQQ